jgi:hypothetical protein
MRMLHLLAALLLVPSLAMPVTAPARAKTRAARVFVGTRTTVGNQPRPYRSEGREIIAPPWSAACMSDHGPSQCGEHMWIYGSSEILRGIEQHQE